MLDCKVQVVIKLQRPDAPGAREGVTCGSTAHQGRSSSCTLQQRQGMQRSKPFLATARILRTFMHTIHVPKHKAPSCTQRKQPTRGSRSLPCNMQQPKEPQEPPVKRQKSDVSAAPQDPPSSAAAATGTADAPSAAVPAAAAAGAPPCAAPSSSDQPPQQQQHVPVAAACSEDKGCRQSMEDVWVIDTDARSEARAQSPPALMRVAFFGVFDGHGGRNCAAAAAERLHRAALAAGIAPEEVRRAGFGFLLV